MTPAIFATVVLSFFFFCFVLPEKAYRSSRGKGPDLSPAAVACYIIFTIAVPVSIGYFGWHRNYDPLAFMTCIYCLSLFGKGTREIYRDTFKLCKNTIQKIYKVLYFKKEKEVEEAW